MKREDLFVTVAIAAGVALSPPLVRAQGFNPPEARVWSAAQAGPAQLRGFVQRTRMVYALDYGDYANPVRDAHDAGVSAEFGLYDAAASGPGEGTGEGSTMLSTGTEAARDAFREQLARDMKFE